MTKVQTVENYDALVVAGYHLEPGGWVANSTTVARAAAVAPDNVVLLANASIALYVGATGDVKVALVGGGAPITMVNLAAGVWHPIRATQVFAAGTTATGILYAY